MLKYYFILFLLSCCNFNFSINNGDLFVNNDNCNINNNNNKIRSHADAFSTLFIGILPVTASKGDRSKDYRKCLESLETEKCNLENKDEMTDIDTDTVCIY